MVGAGIVRSDEPLVNAQHLEEMSNDPNPDIGYFLIPFPALGHEQFQVFRRPTIRYISNFVGRAAGDDASPVFSSSRPKVDDPIHLREDAHIMFYDDDCVSRIDKSLQLAHQAVDVSRMEAGGRFVEDIKRTTMLRAL